VASPGWDRLNSPDPHRPQNTFSKPSSGIHERRCSCPCTTANDPGAVRPLADAAAPLRRWQRVQWQYDAQINGSEIS
jgi:hypothetical protein